MVQIAVVNKDSIPKMPWRRVLRLKLKSLKPDQSLVLFFPRNKSIKNVQDAWRIVTKQAGRVPFCKSCDHELGKTLYLWTE